MISIEGRHPGGATGVGSCCGRTEPQANMISMNRRCRRIHRRVLRVYNRGGPATWANDKGFDAEASDDLIANPDAFVVACMAPAMRHGERRIKIDGDVCPYLKSGLETAMSLIHYWYGNGHDNGNGNGNGNRNGNNRSARQPLAIEANTRSTPLLSKRSRSA